MASHTTKKQKARFTFLAFLFSFFCVAKENIKGYAAQTNRLVSACAGKGTRENNAILNTKNVCVPGGRRRLHHRAKLFRCSELYYDFFSFLHRACAALTFLDQIRRHPRLASGTMAQTAPAIY